MLILMYLPVLIGATILIWRIVWLIWQTNLFRVLTMNIGMRLAIVSWIHHIIRVILINSLIVKVILLALITVNTRVNILMRYQVISSVVLLVHLWSHILIFLVYTISLHRPIHQKLSLIISHQLISLILKMFLDRRLIFRSTLPSILNFDQLLVARRQRVSLITMWLLSVATCKNTLARLNLLSHFNRIS